MSIRLARSACALILGALAACADAPLQTSPAPVETAGASASTPPAGPALSPLEILEGRGALSPVPQPGEPPHPHALWWPAGFADLPGWEQDHALALWPALRQGCLAPAPGWGAVCRDALRDTPKDDAQARAWLEQRLRVFRVTAPGGDPDGLATGYFEPSIEARRRPQGDFRTPLWAPPPDLAARKPYWTRKDLDTLPEAQTGLRGRELAFVADPLDALLLQVQGSGRVHLVEPDGRERWVRMAFAGHNEQPYRSIGRWLIDQGELKAGEASWPAIKDWARRNPARLNELLWNNPRVVFFREEPLLQPEFGPRGAQRIALTPGRSIAVDPAAVPYGGAVWLDTSEPLSARPLQRLTMAQDTGSAITGAVRVDLFWGWGDEAEAQAGRMKQPLRVWVLWPQRSDAR